MNTFPYTPRGLVLAGVFLALSPARALADEPVELEPIQVRTASRTSEDISRSLAAVSVITAEDIRQSVAQDLLELLRLEAGVDVVRTGGAGQQTSVFMRGSNSNHTLVLIDGVRVSSTHTGAFAWEHLPLNQVERVEIVRGPRGSLYGSDAMGGVIQVFTRQVDAPFLRLVAGSHASRELESGTGFRVGEVQISLSAGVRDTDGFSAQNEAGFSFHPDDDAFESRNVNLSGSGLAADVAWQFRITGIDNTVDFDQGVSTSEQVLGSASAEGTWLDGWRYRIYAGYADDRLTSDFGFFSSLFDSRRLDFGWENRIQLHPGSMAFGIDYYDEQGRSADSYTGERDNAGLFGLWEQDIGPSRLQLSGRLDDNSLFGSELTHQASIRIQAGEQGEIIVSRGTAFRAPTLSEQFSPGFGGLFAGNPALQPETSDTVELIYRLDTGPGSRLSIAAYRSRVDGLIAFSGPDFQAININQAALDGVEIEYQRQWGPWQSSANLSLQDSEDRSTGQDLLRRPDRKASLSLTRQFDAGSWLRAEWFVSGERADVGGQVLPGYALVNAALGYPLTASTTLELRLDNLLDHQYEPARGFNGAGRALFLSAHWAR
jgi:vitamin B12 transporter